MEKIDFVVPYVNNKDPLWQKTFLDYAQSRGYYTMFASMRGDRYEDSVGLIYYQLQLVDKFMPWINNIYLILSNKEQIIPSLLPKKVKIVYHNEFIPIKYLPTFNSTTIEMFLWNIKGLSEKFIYANDDMLPLKPLKPSDFYYAGHIKMNWIQSKLGQNPTMYQKQCYNSYKSVIKVTGLVEKLNYYTYPEHTFTPMFKSHCIECFEKIKDRILPHIRAFRSEFQHNQYIYPLYEDMFYGVYPSKISFFYSQLEEKEFEKRMKNASIMCANLYKNKENVTILTHFLEELCKS